MDGRPPQWTLPSEPLEQTGWGAYQSMRLRSMVEREWSELDIAIDDVYRRHEEEQTQS